MDRTELAGRMREELPVAVDEVVAAIGREVPAYRRPLEGAFGRGVRLGVTESLSRFVDWVARPDAGGARDARIYRDLGRGEARAGRSLDALLAAYRVGTRVSWRRLSAVAVAAGVPAGELADLAQAGFVYIDELSAESAEGDPREQLARAGEAQRRRHRLAGLLAAGQSDVAAVEDAALAAGWPLPTTLAVVLLAPGAQPERLAGRIGPDVLAASLDAGPVLFVPDPEGPGRRGVLARALEGIDAGIGSAMAPLGAHVSLRRAAGVLRLPGTGPRRADDHLPELVLSADPALASAFADRALARLEGEEDWVLAWLEEGRAATPTARRLGVHPQTVRYRVRRLRERFGGALDDPARRFELELALRIRRLG